MGTIFTEGSCFNLYLLLKQIWPQAECYYDDNHIITKIDNKFYDINGVVVNPPDYTMKLTDRIHKCNLSRAIKQLQNCDYDTGTNQ